MTTSMKTAGSAKACLVNGALVDSLPVNDRGLAYGDGVFETLRVVNGNIPLAAYHFSRMKLGLHRLRIDQDLAVITDQALQLARELGDGLVKIIVTRGSGQRGYAPPVDGRPTVIFQTSDVPVYPAERAERGVLLFPCSTPLAKQPLLAGIKHLNRLEQVLARAEWDDPAYAEGLVCDTDGLPVECTMSNLFARVSGEWLTPALASCGVRGVMRDYLMDAMRASGERVAERQLTRTQLLAADEVFCCNSVFGVWPVTGLLDKHWPIGPSTRGVQAMAQQVFK